MANRPEELTSKLTKEQAFLSDAVKGAKQYLKENLGLQAVIPPEYHYLPRGGGYEAWKQWLKAKDNPT